MEWDLCSSTPLVPFHPYTMFQNPMPKPSCQKYRKTTITQKYLSKFSHSALQLAYPKSYMSRFSSLFKHFFLLKLTFFLIFYQEELSKQPLMLILTGKNDQVNQTSVSTCLGHQMPPLGIHQST